MDRKFTLREAMTWLTLAALVAWAWSGTIRNEFMPSLREQFKVIRDQVKSELPPANKNGHQPASPQP